MDRSPVFPEATIRRYASIDSTNAEAKRLIRAGEKLPVTLVADMQTAGRGRLGRSFHSPAGTGLYMTYAFRPDADGFRPAALTCASAVALARAIRKLTGIETGIKWVNDLYLDGKKIAGILAEGVFSPEGELTGVLTGIGLNLCTKDFPEDIRDKAGSLPTDVTDRDLWLRAILEELIPLTAASDPSSYMAEYRARSTVTGHAVTVLKNGASRPAQALSILDGGELLVRYEDGTEEALFSGEVSVKI